MRLPFCDYHISIVLDRLNQSQKPLDLVLSDYFRSHKSIGANDRRMIGETLYKMVRYKSLIDFIAPSDKGIEKLYAFKNASIESMQKDLSIPEHIRLGISPFLFETFKKQFGLEKTRELAALFNENAPVTIRANGLKTTREALFEKLKKQFDVTLSTQSPWAIQFKKREPLFALSLFKEGFFEVQDEGSQIVADLVDVKPKEHFLDYCSGSGGKTLAIAPKMQGQGQIYLNDNRPFVLKEARKRLKRAGVQNAQFVLPKKKVDWLLLDVPCSGSGTLRRNPELKWKIDREMLDRLIMQQRAIVSEAIEHLKPNGKLVYVTCSLFQEENEEQVENFLKTHPLVLEEQKSLSLIKGGHDAFFAAVFKKQELV